MLDVVAVACYNRKAMGRGSKFLSVAFFTRSSQNANPEHFFR